VGLQILTQSGQAHEAFALLEAFAVKPKMGMLRPWGAKARSAREEQCAIPMSILAMNDFMVSLIRAGRPDVVFKLWDHMDMLYGIIPDALCLNNLLDAARVAAKMDDSFSGVLGELALKNPFRRVPRTATGREEVVDSIRRILDGGRSYSSGVWNEAPAWQGAIQTFRQVIIGNWPELKHVGGPGRGAGFAGAFEQGDGLARKHVQIVPLESTFFRYIRLLGGVSMGAEIPLGLVWMRELGIGPSRRTLAIALVLWGEVGGKREYEELVRWVREWVGDEGMPNDEDMRHWVRRRD
jgi:pentatricopeptide repeat protein